MSAKTRVLFVCTGNIFRSASAEYALKQHLKKVKCNLFEVSSAGTIAKREPMSPTTIETLKKHNIDPSKHKQRKLTKKILDENDVIVAMSKDHQEFIKQKFRRSSILFEKLAINRNKPLKDVNEVIPDYKNHKNKTKNHIKKTVEHIIKETPKVFNELYMRNYLFTDFVKNKKRHRAGLPFIPLHETKNTLAFMSIDIPEQEDGHVLVIPKEKYKDFEKIPLRIQKELIDSINLIVKALKKTHAGYNILLNSGAEAGQFINHAHFHIIPRNIDDEIKIEVWKSQKLNKNKYIKYNKILKKEINKILK